MPYSDSYNFNSGTPGMIRTCDPLIRSQVLYPAELRVRKTRIARLQTVREVVKLSNCLTKNPLESDSLPHEENPLEIELPFLQ